MGKINILDSSVFNVLAAGEVVERPASVVKELVENSIDAGATAIDITIEDGGARLIEVSDNGVGIAPDDMRAAFLPHATSKLARIADLDSLSTLGFRGEALASIASISEVTAISAIKGSSVASKLVLKGGTVVSQGVAARDVGTAISVANLFFNTPARLKFLKKPAIEQRYVEDVVKRLILANPELSISLYADKERVISSRSGALIDAIVSVFGAKDAACLIPISSPDGARIRVSGYVSSPERTKSSRACQSIVINGRSVSDQTVQTAVEKAYGDLLMKRCFPIFAIDIVMPFDAVDVNVHPSKTEVRFADKQAVFGAVYHAVYDAVHNLNTGEKKEADGTQPTQTVLNSSQFSAAESSTISVGSAPKRIVQPRIDSSRYFATPSPTLAFRESAIGAYASFDGEHTHFDSSNSNQNNEDAQRDDAPISDAEPRDISSGYCEARFDGKIVGQIFSTYLIVERDDVVYIIDQHAAHERILYDKIYAKTKPEFSQPLLIPYKLSLSAEETERFEYLLEPLKTVGFEIERRDTSYVIQAVPEPISKINFSKFFSQLIANSQTFAEGVSLAELIRDSLCQQACKAAIKGGEELTRGQIERVLATFTAEDGKLPEKCPHGRPAVVTLSKVDIEKLFKRIV